MNSPLISQGLASLAVTLRSSELAPEMTREDLINAMLILSSVTAAIMVQQGMEAGALTFEQQAELAEEFGQNLHQIVLRAVGIDTKESEWPEVLET